MLAATASADEGYGLESVDAFREGVSGHLVVAFAGVAEEGEGDGALNVGGGEWSSDLHDDGGDIASDDSLEIDK